MNANQWQWNPSVPSYEIVMVTLAEAGTNMGTHPGMVAAANPYPAGYSLANIPGVDWSALGYSLPAMYTL